VYLPLDSQPAGSVDGEPPIAQSATTTGD
jgi:hypothetical protein